jgi:toxin ParE1/3/4
MRVVFTEAAIEDLENIAAVLAASFPDVAPAVERRLGLVIARIARWPASAKRVVERPNVRVAPLVRYPYHIFYRATDDAVEILHISHTSRRAPWE